MVPTHVEVKVQFISENFSKINLSDHLKKSISKVTYVDLKFVESKKNIPVKEIHHVTMFYLSIFHCMLISRSGPIILLIFS